MRLRSLDNDTLGRVKKAVQRVIEKHVDDDSDFITDLGMDSLDVVEVVTLLDEKYELEDKWEDYFSPRLTDAILGGGTIKLDPKSMAEFIDANYRT